MKYIVTSAEAAKMLKKVLDEKKRKICQDKGVILVEWKYNFNITNKNLQTLLRDALRSV